MKKTISLLLAAMMLLGMIGTALAYDEEITFQGIPWGSSYEKAAQILFDSGFFIIDEEFISQMDEKELFQNILNAMYLSRSTPTYLIENKGTIRVGSSSDFEKVGYECYVTNPFGKIKTIGGYSFNPLMYFAGNGEDEALIAVSLSAGSDKAMFDDLEKKLTSVYGDRKTGKAETLTGSKATYYAWLGSNNSCVWLFNDFGRIRLVYGTLDAENILNEYLSAAPTKKPVDSTDVEGL